MFKIQGATLTFGIALLLLSSTSFAQTSGYSGSSGTTVQPAANAPATTTALGKPLPPTTPVVTTPVVAAPGVMTPQVMSPAAPAAPMAPANIASTLPGAPPVTQPTVDTQKTDPCSQYMYAYNAYVTCQDRMQKIDRMKAASAKRMDAFKAPPAPPPVVVATPPANGKPAPTSGAASATPGDAAAPTTATPAAATTPVVAATPGTVTAPVTK